jgi:Ankyrin repeats (3 copies)
MRLMLYDIVNGNIPPHDYDKKGITPLLAAVDAANPTLVKQLLDHDAVSSVNTLDDRKMSPLHVAATLEDSFFVKILLEHGAEESISIKDFRGLTPFQRSIIAGRVQAAQMMLKAKPELAKTINQPDEFGITDVQRAGRSGNVEMMNLLLSLLGDEQIKVDAKAFFTQEELEDCLAVNKENFLETLPINDVAFPLTIAQNYCNTMIGLKNGKILKIRNADALEVRAALLEKKYGPGAYDTQDLNVLTLYMNPMHAYLRLECRNCDGGKPYNENRGFYPLHGTGIISSLGADAGSGVTGFGMGYGMQAFIVPSAVGGLQVAKFPFVIRRGVVGNEDISESFADVNNLLKIKFYLDDQQAKSALKRIQKTESACNDPYNPTCVFSPAGKNCVDFMLKIFKSAGGRGDFASYFADNQLSSGRTQLYAFMRSRGVGMPLVGKIINEFSPIIGLEKDYFFKSFPPSNLIVDRIENPSSVREIDLPQEVFPQIAPGKDPENCLPPYPLYFAHSLMLGAVAVKVAFDAHRFVTVLWGKIVGEKVSREEFSQWRETQESLLTDAMNMLDFIGAEIDSRLVELDELIDNVKKEILFDNPEFGILYHTDDKSTLDALKAERSGLSKLWNDYIDLQFDGMELEEELDLLKGIRGLPTKTHLADLEKRIGILFGKVKS